MVTVGCQLVHRPSNSWQRGLGALALAVAGASAACVGPATEPDRVDWLDRDSHRIVVTAKPFADAEAVRVGFADRWQWEEYALFKAGGGQLELVFAEAKRDFSVALDYQMPITTMVPTWNANARGGLAWGPLGRFDWRPGTWFYRTYRPGGAGRPCVGLLIEWDHVTEDPLHRPRRVLFGYACGAAGATLADEDVRALIRGIAIRPRDAVPGRRRVVPGGPPSRDTGADGAPAIAAAKGQGAAKGSGNPRFPFAFARYYSEGGGGKLP